MTDFDTHHRENSDVGMNLDKANASNENERAKNFSSPQKRIFVSEELFKGEKEVIIQHSRDRYRLSITKAGKLILNK